MTKATNTANYLTYSGWHNVNCLPGRQVVAKKILPIINLALEFRL